MDSNTNKNYSITNFYLAAFLLTKGLNLVGIDRTNPQRSRFQFVKSPQWERLIEAFSFAKDNDPEVLIDARKFVTAIKSLKEKLYLNKF